MVLAIPSKEPKELSPEEGEFLEAMARLQKNPLFQKLVEAVEQKREEFVVNLARDLTLKGGPHVDPVNQRYIDYQRGFWNGAIYAVTRFPKQKAKDWDKYLAETKESDDA